RRLHFLEARAHDDLDIFAAEAARGAAAVHGRIATAEHDDALADLVDVTEGDRREPVDADMDIGSGFLPAGNFELATAGCARSDEDCVPAFRQKGLEAVDALAAAKFYTEVEDIAALLVDNRFRQTEAWNLRADHAAGFGVLIEYDAMIA